MEALISQGASVTVKDNVTKRTPLHASGERALMLFTLQHRSSYLYYWSPTANPLSFISLVFFPLSLWFRSPSRGILYFSTSLLHCPHLLAPTLPSISTYSLRSVVFPLWQHLLMFPQPEKKQNRESENTCLTTGPVEERLKIQVGSDWWSKLSVFCSGKTIEIYPFRHYSSPELSCKLALAGSLLHSPCVECWLHNMHN